MRFNCFFRPCLAFLVCLTALGCSTNYPPNWGYQPPPANQNQPPTQPNPTNDSYQMAVVGWKSLTLSSGQQANLQVRFTKNNQAMAGAGLQFTFVGDARDSVLSSFSANTDHQGFATVTLTGGQIAAAYRVRATSPQTGHSIDWSVSVQSNGQTNQTNSKLQGAFELTSQFDIQDDFAGSSLSPLLNMLNDMSDDPEDPGKFLVELILDEIAKNNEWLKTAAMLVGPLLYSTVNDLLTSVSPQIISQTKQVAADLSAVARKFKTKSTFTIPAQSGNSVTYAEHRLDKIGWDFHGQPVEYSFSQLGMASPTAYGVLATGHGTTMNIDPHNFDLKFGAFLLVALNNTVIPFASPNAQSLGDLLASYVNCADVGAAIDNQVGLGGQSLWQSGCTMGLNALGGVVNNMLINIDDSGSILGISGATQLLDHNNDGLHDELQNGFWTGNLRLDKANIVIAGQGNHFTGQRIQ